MNEPPVPVEKVESLVGCAAEVAHERVLADMVQCVLHQLILRLEHPVAVEHVAHMAYLGQVQMKMKKF